MIIAEKYINLLIQMLAIPSLSKDEDTRADFLQAWLVNEGLKVQRVINNLIVTNGNDPAEATILLNSHIDTVAPGEGWDSDPYLPLVKGGMITGLGSNDAGASVVSLIAAYQVLSDENLSENVVLVISAEEEVSGMNGLTAVIPLLPKLKFAVVGEPSGMCPALAERGLMVIDAIARGIQGHAARGEGVNAIYKAIEDIRRIRELEFTDHSLWLKDPSVNVTIIQAGTGHNVIPGKCEFVVDVRSNDKYSNTRLFELLCEVCESELTARSMRLRSSYLSEDHPVNSVLKQLAMEPFGSPTLSDMALLEIPAIKIGPGDSARSHTANEYIFIEEITDAIAVYSSLIKAIINLKL